MESVVTDTEEEEVEVHYVSELDLWKRSSNKNQAKLVVENGSDREKDARCCDQEVLPLIQENPSGANSEEVVEEEDDLAEAEARWSYTPISHESS